ncbi:MAG: hypothetical protein COA63_014200 [Methylophaga sp.]|nr:hypothetical protein [Methylophaga sp.]
MTITNNTGISLAMAVWLAHDEYSSGAEKHSGKDVISVTSLMKSPRQIILTRRIPTSDKEAELDVTDLIASRFGTAMHDSIENAWTGGYVKAMRRLGYPEKVINSIKINPESVEEGDIPIYLEQRSFKEIDGVTISGKYDQIVHGQLNDTKTMSVWGYINGTKDEDFKIQGSIYRWLNQDKVTSDTLMIQMIFTDWSKADSKQNPKYPSERIVEYPIQLMSIQETETWMRTRIRTIRANAKLDEPDILYCTDKELWRSDPKYKYFSDAAKAKVLGARSSKNFDNLADANAWSATKGKGVVVTFPGVVRACAYCGAYEICSQKDDLNHA